MSFLKASVAERLSSKGHKGNRGCVGSWTGISVHSWAAGKVTWEALFGELVASPDVPALWFGAVWVMGRMGESRAGFGGSWVAGGEWYVPVVFFGGAAGGVGTGPWRLRYLAAGGACRRVAGILLVTLKQ